MWEYKTLKLNLQDFVKSDDKMIEKLNELGKDRWELVTSIAHAAGSGIMGISGTPVFATFLFKRPTS
jgi:hypothetical protein